MKLKSTFVTHDLNGQQVLLSTGGADFAGIVRSNKTAAFIIDCLKQETTPTKIADAMVAQFDVPRERAESGVDYVVEQLRSIGALDE